MTVRFETSNTFRPDPAEVCGVCQDRFVNTPNQRVVVHQPNDQHPFHADCLRGSFQQRLAAGLQPRCYLCDKNITHIAGEAFPNRCDCFDLAARVGITVAAVMGAATLLNYAVSSLNLIPKEISEFLQPSFSGPDLIVIPCTTLLSSYVPSRYLVPVSGLIAIVQAYALTQKISHMHWNHPNVNFGNAYSSEYTAFRDKADNLMEEENSVSSKYVNERGSIIKKIQDKLTEMYLKTGVFGTFEGLAHEPMLNRRLNTLEQAHLKRHDEYYSILKALEEDYSVGKYNFSIMAGVSFLKVMIVRMFTNFL